MFVIAANVPDTMRLRWGGMCSGSFALRDRASWRIGMVVCWFHDGGPWFHDGSMWFHDGGVWLHDGGVWFHDRGICEAATTCSHLSEPGSREKIVHRAGYRPKGMPPRSLSATLLPTKGFIASYNSTTVWRKRVQIPEAVEDIAYSKHYCL